MQGLDSSVYRIILEKQEQFMETRGLRSTADIDAAIPKPSPRKSTGVAAAGAAVDSRLDKATLASAGALAARNAQALGRRPSSARADAEAEAAAGKGTRVASRLVVG